MGHWADTVRRICQKHHALSLQDGQVITICYNKTGQGSIISRAIETELIGKVAILNIKLIPNELKLEVSAREF